RNKQYWAMVTRRSVHSGKAFLGHCSSGIFWRGLIPLKLICRRSTNWPKTRSRSGLPGIASGGALAVLAAARLKSKGITSSLYTYGQPRVGFGDFADRFGVELPGRLVCFVHE